MERTITSAAFPTLSLTGWQRTRNDSVKISGSGSVTLAAEVTIEPGQQIWTAEEVFGKQVTIGDNGFFVGELWIGDGTSGTLQEYIFLTMDTNGNISAFIEGTGAATINTGNYVTFRFEL